MAAFAIVKNGVVVNLAASDVPLSDNWIEIKRGTVAVGDLYNGQNFTPAPAPTKLPEEVERQRLEAYRTESDPLFFKAQRGEATQQEWLDKIAEIKLRYTL